MEQNLFFRLAMGLRTLTVLISVLMSFTVSSSTAFSAEPAVQDREIIEKAKGKKYRGGAEEGELQVQGQLLKPQRKIAPVIDRKESETSQDHD